MLKDVLHVRQRRLFVHKLLVLQRRQYAIQLLLGSGDDLAHQAERKLPPHDGKLLEQGFFVRREPINARRQHALDRSREVQRGWQRCDLSRSSSVTDYHTLLKNSWIISSIKNGVPSVFSRMSCLRV